MQPIMRIILPIIGVLIAASLGSPASRAFDLGVGAAVGFLIAELGIIRTRLGTVQQEFERLKQELRRRQNVPSASAPRTLQNATAAPTGASWICAKCGEQLEPQFTSCWRCGAASVPKATEYPEYQPGPTPKAWWYRFRCHGRVRSR
jgi:hypothetical protein